MIPQPTVAALNTLGVARDGSTVVVSYVVHRGQIVRVDGPATLEAR